MKRLTLSLALVALALAAFAPAALAQDEKPRIAVIEFENKADNQYWWSGGGAALQDNLVTELVKSGKFRVIDREKLDAIMREKGLQLSGDIDPATANELGKLLGLNYLLTGAVTEYGVDDAGGSGFGISVKRRRFTAAVNARIISVQTGEILWADEAQAEEKSGNVRVFGVGGGVDDRRMFDKVMEPIVGELVASLKAADL